MACRIAENGPLKALAADLGIGFQCHSFREHCVLGRERVKGESTLGSQGAIMGYCQALFNREGSYEDHTKRLTSYLNEIDAPWSRSHELFWGHKDMSSTESGFLRSAIQPLVGGGRVPIVISSLDPGVSTDRETIESIIKVDQPVTLGETLLLRVVLQSKESIQAACEITRNLYSRAKQSKTMPSWWLLLQASSTEFDWSIVKDSFGDLWRFVNIAVNPFTPSVVYQTCSEQITVAQFIVPDRAGINSNGTIVLPSYDWIPGWQPSASYDINDYASRLAELPEMPTTILLGPAISTWNVDENKLRIRKFLDLYETVSEKLWHEVPKENREEVWAMEA